MQYKELGNTGIFVSRMCLGTMTFGALNWPNGDVLGRLNQTEVDTLVGRSIDAGVNFFDTADVYSQGNSETMLGKALSNNRNDVIISTKVAGRVGSGVNQLGASRVHLLRQVEAIDIVNLRVGGSEAPMPGSLAEQFSVLAQMQQEGLIKHLRVSTVNAEQIAEAQSIAPIVCVQNLYNLANRQDDALVDSLATQGIAYVPYFPLGGFSPLQSETLAHVAERLHTTRMAVALAWLLQRSPNILLIPGTTLVEHLRANVAGASLQLPDDAIEELNAIAG
jgi:pyridoxine 4-dehydrogenase